MKQSKWDILLGGLFYCAPFWGLLVTIVVDDFKSHTPMSDTSTLAFVTMMAFWCLGMNLVRTQYLEEEVERLNKKLDEKE